MSTVNLDRKQMRTRDRSASILYAPGHEPLEGPGSDGAGSDGAGSDGAGSDGLPEPPYFGDLNLDQVLAELVSGRESHRLEQFFYAPLRDEEAVRYRQEALQELERDEIHAAVSAFAAGMRELRACRERSQKLRNPHQRRRWFLAGMEAYRNTVTEFGEFMSAHEFSSRALAELAEHIRSYTASPEFADLGRETDSVVRELAEIRYSVRIKGLRVTVDAYHDEPDLTARVEETFAKFRQGDVGDHLARFPSHDEASSVEDQILLLVAKLFPEQFEHLRSYCERHEHAADPTLLRFDREAQFCLAYLEYIAPLRAVGLEFSYPQVSSASKQLSATDTFDIALAGKLAEHGHAVVTNDLRLDGDERALVITGPNQGGKTTFARTFGQLHHLAALGLPVPGTDTRVFLPDRVFTHFERREDLATLRSKFEDELQRMHEILEQATGDSVLVMNESFTSTTLSDAVEVGTLVMEQVLEREIVCVCVTFVDELSRLSEQVVSMMSTVAVDDPTRRTFKVIRKPADGLAHALALAARHGLSYERLKQRLAPTEQASPTRGARR